MNPSPRDLPKHNDLFWPVVLALRQLDGSADNDHLVEKVSELLALPDELTAIPHKSGPQSEIGYRIAWSKTWLKWGGMLDNPERGVWVLTELGRRASENEVNSVSKRLRAESAARGKPEPAKPKLVGEAAEEAPASEELDAYASDDWQTALLSVIKAMPASGFERLVRLLLLRLGFSHVEVVGRSGDGGIDLLGVVKINNVLSFRVLAQCKRYKDSVGPADMRNFRGAMQGRTDKGIFVTSGRFTREAKTEASRDGVPTIDLVDGEALAKLLKDLKMGVDTEMIERVTVQQQFFSGF